MASNRELLQRIARDHERKAFAMRDESSFFDPEIETMPRSELAALQWSRLKDLIALAYDHGGLVRAKWDEAGVKPADIKSLADFSRLVPFITKDDLRAYRDAHQDPFGGVLLREVSELRSITGTSGTTGDPTLISRRDLQPPLANSLFNRGYWDLGLRPGEFAVTANPTMRGSTIMPMMTFGLIPIAIDHTPLEIPRLVELSRAFRPTFLSSLSTPLLMGLEQFELDTGVDLVEVFQSYKAILWGGEPLGPRGRSMTERWKMNIFNIVSLGDATIALESSTRTGAYAWEDEVFVEHLDPATMLPAEDGSLGELVVTPLQNTVDPLIRFRSEDLVWLTREPCKTGRTHLRYMVEGRAGDQIMVAGKVLLPIKIWPTIESQPETKAGLFQIVRPPESEDFLRLRVGYAGAPDLASLEQRLIAEIRQQLEIESRIELVPNDDLLKLGPPHKIPRIVKL
jgi:phenylacetate-CoA ligase